MRLTAKSFSNRSIVKLASIKDIPKEAIAVPGGYYKIAHDIWAIERTGDDVYLVRQKQDPNWTIGAGGMAVETQAMVQESKIGKKAQLGEVTLTPEYEKAYKEYRRWQEAYMTPGITDKQKSEVKPKLDEAIRKLHRVMNKNEKKAQSQQAIDEFKATLGLGPLAIPVKAQERECPRCHKHRAYFREEGADCDAGQDEIVLYCPDCRLSGDNLNLNYVHPAMAAFELRKTGGQEKRASDAVVVDPKLVEELFEEYADKIQKYNMGIFDLQRMLQSDGFSAAEAIEYSHAILMPEEYERRRQSRRQQSSKKAAFIMSGGKKVLKKKSVFYGEYVVTVTDVDTGKEMFLGWGANELVGDYTEALVFDNEFEAKEYATNATSKFPKAAITVVYNYGMDTEKKVWETEGALWYEARKASVQHKVADLASAYFGTNDDSNDGMDFPLADDIIDVNLKTAGPESEYTFCDECETVIDMAKAEIVGDEVLCRKCKVKKRVQAGLRMADLFIKQAVVKKEKDGWHVRSEEGKNLGGPYKTEEEANKRLRQVEYFKHKGSKQAYNISRYITVEFKPDANGVDTVYPYTETNVEIFKEVLGQTSFPADNWSIVVEEFAKKGFGLLNMTSEKPAEEVLPQKRKKYKNVVEKSEEKNPWAGLELAEEPDLAFSGKKQAQSGITSPMAPATPAAPMAQQDTGEQHEVGDVVQEKDTGIKGGVVRRDGEIIYIHDQATNEDVPVHQSRVEKADIAGY